MPRILRVNDPDGEPIGTADSPDGIKRVIDGLGPGRYDVDEHSLDPFPGTKVSARAWGKVIHRQDGQVVLDQFPWQT
jgi:hypothetical protein